jgi:substrate import-associated zinc metallohydrolase lipoprotein
MYTYILFAALTLGLPGCKKETALPTTPIVGLGGDTWVKRPLDFWIDKNYVDPYNIEVKYKWDPYELNYAKNLVPVLESQVEPVMTAVRDIYIKPYEQVAGNSFIKKYSPKLFQLAGSAEYNENGTVVLGQAEGGRKIVLMVINQFDKANVAEVQRMLHTIHHEFAHILHQIHAYPVEWKGLNPDKITAAWFNTTDEEANTQGLVTAYAKASPDEDFVETVAVLLVNGQAYFDAIVNNPYVPQASKKILRQKESIVVDFYQKEYNIDFRKLQEVTKQAILNSTK